MSAFLSIVLVLVSLQSADEPIANATTTLGPVQPSGFSDGDIAALARESIVADLRGVAISADEFGRAANRRPDLEVAREVDALLRKGLDAVPMPLSVSCHRGNVLLRGRAKDRATLGKATEIASGVPGVRAVLNRMQSPGTFGAAPSVEATEPEAPSRTDAFAFLTSDGLAATNVILDVTDGEVVVEGYANSQQAKTYATASVGRVRGVRMVRNYMTVRPTSAVEDERIGRLVHKKLHWEQTLHDVADDLEVSVVNGILTLSGQVDTVDQADLARLLAAETQGIVVLDDRLTIAGSNF